MRTKPLADDRMPDFCQKCRSPRVTCQDSRPCSVGRRRRYACQDCGERWSSYEMVDAIRYVPPEAKKTLHEMTKQVKAMKKATRIFEEQLEIFTARIHRGVRSDAALGIVGSKQGESN